MQQTLNISTFETPRLAANMLRYLHHLLQIYNTQTQRIYMSIERKLVHLHNNLPKQLELEHITGVSIRAFFVGNWYERLAPRGGGALDIDTEIHRQ